MNQRQNESSSTQKLLGELSDAKKSFGLGHLNHMLIQVIGPILLILMISALVYFLIEVLYRGPHATRMRWVFGLFTAATVLVSRISIEEGYGRASVFGFVLGVATLVVGMTIIDFEYGVLNLLKPVVITLFILLVMWSANRLTWDCTLIDDSRDVSSIGLTEIIKRKFSGEEKAARRKRSLEREADPEIESKKNFNPLFLLFANSGNQNTPGLWVVYFAIAAFPIFGLGQWFVEADGGWGYRWIFLLFAVYLASALGLLMLTSLMGLQRYLNKRSADMPDSIAHTWLLLGTLFAIATMIVTLLIPSPNLGPSFENGLAFLTTNSDKQTSELAVGEDGNQQGDNPNQKVDDQAEEMVAGNKKDKDGPVKGKGNDKKGGQSGDKEKGNDKKSSKDDNSKSKNSKSDQKEKSNSNKSKEQSDSKSDPNEQSKNDDQGESGEQDSKQEADSDDNKGENQKAENADKPNEQQGDKQQNNNAQRDPKQKNQRQQNANQQPPKNKKAPQQNSSKLSSSASNFMRFVVIAIGALVLIALAILFREELAKLFSALFISKKPELDEEILEEQEKLKRIAQLPPFDRFREPFSSGQAANWAPAQTVDYTFQALEAWARDHEAPRAYDQTPHEFAALLASVDPGVSAEAKRLADLFAQCHYSGQKIQPADVAKLKRIWQLMLSRSPDMVPTG